MKIYLLETTLIKEGYGEVSEKIEQLKLLISDGKIRKMNFF